MIVNQSIRSDGRLDMGANLNALADQELAASLQVGGANFQGHGVSSLFNDLPGVIVTTTVPVSRLVMAVRFRIALSSGGSGAVSSSGALSSTMNLYSRGSVLRAPAGGVRVSGRLYKGGQFYPGPRLYFGKQAYNPIFAPIGTTGTTAAPWATSLMNAPAWVRYGTAAGLGGAAIYRNYRMHVDR